MIGKITAPRGERVEPLIHYLYGPGRREEHTDPHIVAGWRHPAELEPPLREDGKRDYRRLHGLLNQPHAALGTRGMARPVWHCSMRAAPEDKMLSDDDWAQIGWDVMNRTGGYACPGATAWYGEYSRRYAQSASSSGSPYSAIQEWPASSLV